MFFCNLLQLFFVFSFNLVLNVQSLDYEGINSGLVAKWGELPYHANIEIKFNNEKNDERCGGAILDQSHIVTAAHCVTDEKGSVYLDLRIIVKAGSIDQYEPRYETYVKGVYLPINYTRNGKDFYANIAVLKLTRKILFNRYQNIATVQLADKLKTYERVEANLTGFGYVDVDFKWNKNNEYSIEGTLNNLLHYGETIILSKDDCMKTGSTRIDFDDQLCAQMKQDRTSGRGTCYGDDGGPLVVVDKKSKKNILVGVLSLSVSHCNEITIPSRYTRVSSYLDFIQAARADKINNLILTYTDIKPMK